IHERQIIPQRFFYIMPVQLFLLTIKTIDMPWLDIVDIMHDNVFWGSFQQSIIDNDTVILFRQFCKLAVNHTVERVLVTPEDLGTAYLLQPLKQLLRQLLLPPFYQIH